MSSSLLLLLLLWFSLREKAAQRVADEGVDGINLPPRRKCDQSGEFGLPFHRRGGLLARPTTGEHRGQRFVPVVRDSHRPVDYFGRVNEVPVPAVILLLLGYGVAAVEVHHSVVGLARIAIGMKNLAPVTHLSRVVPQQPMGVKVVAPTGLVVPRRVQNLVRFDRRCHHQFHRFAAAVVVVVVVVVAVVVTAPSWNNKGRRNASSHVKLVPFPTTNSCVSISGTSRVIRSRTFVECGRRAFQ